MSWLSGGLPRKARKLCAIAAASLSCALFAVLWLPVSIAAAKPTYATSGCSNSIYKPNFIALTCADAKVRFEVESWNRWERHAAHGAGVLSYPDCRSNVPLVACKDYAEHEATINLYRAVYCSTTGRFQFTRLLVEDLEAPTPATRQFRSSYRCSQLHSPEGKKQPPYFTRCPTSDVLALGTLERHKVSCSKARRLVLGFIATANEFGVMHATVEGFRCSNVSPRLQPGIICKQDEKRARFLGAPNA